jgi:hypothetical protein
VVTKTFALRPALPVERAGHGKALPRTVRECFQSHTTPFENK